MSRSGYSDDNDNWSHIKWRGQVASAIRGQRGQRLLRELAAAMDAMPEKVLIADDLESDGQYCALGVVGKCRGLDLSAIDPYDPQDVANAFDIAHQLAQEIVHINDECVDEYGWIDVEVCGPMRRGYPDYGCHKRAVQVAASGAAQERWRYVRAWVESQLVSSKDTGEGNA